ncbi:hypothetical protein HI814_03305 [Ralstonia solanacearum]|nr:hypothetical protein HI814_03305 [Ralstonia solanacearum]QKM31823.1 hypothetical protein HI794_03305 [Ralstonia solanacearum]QKM36806.1 hypothetical protein HI793_03305 [Ralstonia solanacearum]
MASNDASAGQHDPAQHQPVAPFKIRRFVRQETRFRTWQNLDAKHDRKDGTADQACRYHQTLGLNTVHACGIALRINRIRWQKNEVRMEDGSGADRHHSRYDGPLPKPTVGGIVMRFAARTGSTPLLADFGK